MLNIFSKRKKEKGFTLVELLVVIAIIGILSTIVVVSISPARNKAKDSSIKAALSQVRAQAEMFYDDNNTYVALAAKAEMVVVLASITSNGGTVTSGYSASAYCVQSTLNGGGSYCVDNTGYVGIIAGCLATHIACN
ncbi:MAG: type II secretion system protein [bacterium]